LVAHEILKPNSFIMVRSFFNWLMKLKKQVIELHAVFYIIAVSVIVLFSQSKAKGQAVFCPPNLGFEDGNYSSWSFFTGTCCPIVTPVNSGPLPNRHVLTSGPGVDQYGLFPLVSPAGGTYSMRLGNNINGAQAEKARYFLHVPPNAVNYGFIYQYAIVFQDPGHPIAWQPRFQVTAYDSVTGVPIPCAAQNYVASSSLQGFFTTPLDPLVRFKPWSPGFFDLSGQAGTTVVIEFATGDCSESGHFGYGYFDIVSCGDFGITVACDTTGSDIILTGPPYYQTYTWWDATYSNILGNTQSITITAPTSPTYFNLVAAPLPGSGCIDTFKSKLISGITVNATPDSVCIDGLPLQLNANANGGTSGLTYSWIPSTGLSCSNCPNPIATVSGGINYIVTVADSNSCFRKDTIHLQASAYTASAGPDLVTCIGVPVQIQSSVTPASQLYSYTWSPSTNLSGSSILSPVFTSSLSGSFQYILAVDSSNCHKVDTVNIKVLQDVVTSDTIVCSGSVFFINASGDPGFTYLWTPSTSLSNPNIVSPQALADTTRTYTLTASHPSCPDIIKTVKIEVEPTPVVDAGPDRGKCMFENVAIYPSVTPSWYTQYVYQWAPAANIITPNNKNILYTGSAAVTLAFNVFTKSGCKGTDSVNISIDPGNFANVSPVDTGVCPGNTIKITASGGKDYVWSPSLYLVDSTASSITVKPVTDVSYTIHVVNANGCKDTISSSIQVYPNGVINLPDSVRIYPGDSYQMDPQGNCLYFSWFPPLGHTATNISNPVASPDVNTRYFINATTEHGCAARDSIDILVSHESLLDIPNAFSPGSAPNDVLKIIKRGQATLKSFKIFNRWGNLVFQTTDIEEGWDGRFKGSPQPMGVYIYYVEAFTNTGKRFYKQGNVTLIR
jgi:gliding motility-associated-like protein